jgi:hypothetical protein
MLPMIFLPSYFAGLSNPDQRLVIPLVIFILVSLNAKSGRKVIDLILILIILLTVIVKSYQVAVVGKQMERIEVVINSNVPNVEKLLTIKTSDNCQRSLFSSILPGTDPALGISYYNAIRDGIILPVYYSGIFKPRADIPFSILYSFSFDGVNNKIERLWQDISDNFHFILLIGCEKENSILTGRYFTGYKTLYKDSRIFLLRDKSR